MTHQGEIRSESATREALPARSWQGAMIAPLADAGEGTQSSFVARDFNVDTVGPTVLHISAQGIYRCFINGVRVGDDLLTPGWTCYDQRIAYQSYEVGHLLQTGQNRIEIWLGDGWYRSQIMWAASPIFNCWGNRIAAIADLEGAVTLATDASWQSGLLPVLKSGIYYGEDYDARVQPVADQGVEVLSFDAATLVPHETSAVKELTPLPAIESWQDEAGTVFDFGQNAAGYVRFTVEGEAGAQLRVEHSEVLGPDRFFDNRNYRSARAEVHYTLRGGAAETYAPLFSFQGFRYARLTFTGQTRILAVEMVPISSVPEVAGGFSTGVPEINRLVQNTIWSQRSNFIEIPTDCPQRDERLGWTGDAQVFAGTACWLADCESFLAKYLRDVMHDQRADGAVPHFSPDPTRLHPEIVAGDWAGSTGWGDAIVVIPWQLYQHYGNPAILRETFPAMIKWLDYLWSIGDGPLLRTNSHWGGKGFTFGDWLQPVGDNRKPRPTIADDCAATIYHFISTDMTAKVAAVLGDPAEADLRRRAAAIKAAFAHEFIAPSGRLAHNDQTSYALCFLYGLIPEAHAEAAKAYFRKEVEDADYLIGTGFIGTPALLPALTKLGMADLAEKMLLNREVPGWLYQVERGATTIWERWDAMAPDGSIYEPSMNSFNHYAYGAVCQWLFEQVAGVTPEQGFDLVDLSPSILPALSPVSAWHDCRHGRIEAGWRLENGTVHYSVLLPEGTTGRLCPDQNHHGYRLNGESIDLPVEGLRLPSGRHEITFTLKS